MLRDPAGAPVSPAVRAALRLIEVLALRPDEVTAADIDEARAAGLDDAAIRDAAMVCVIFSTVTRLADALDFAIPDSFAGSVKALTGRTGYRLPPPALLLPRR
ncbi:MAG TPA: hypothetical protein VHM89_00940 [Acidimicrobiales bacterium]|nr:hypothetical protein [Acidimicrobiales bacterium]